MHRSQDPQADVKPRWTHSPAPGHRFFEAHRLGKNGLGLTMYRSFAILAKKDEKHTHASCMSNLYGWCTHKRPFAVQPGHWITKLLSQIHMQIGQGILTTIKNIQQVLSSRVFLGAFKSRGWLNHKNQRNQRTWGADFLELLQRFLKGHPERTKDIRAQPFLGNWFLCSLTLIKSLSENWSQPAL